MATTVIAHKEYLQPELAHNINIGTENESAESQHQLRYARIQTWAMSFICIFLVVFATAAASQLPQFLTDSEYTRLITIVLFNLFAWAGLADNLYQHYRLYKHGK